ncbi:MAG: NAD(P)/FAD-dependent oxidoreductase [Emcibacter sp.]|nr:NAD(P)/FAD-dependent oxidoreductase [Emcibacter sp.]
MAFSKKISKNSKYDAIVIGAGHNGLTAAAYLGRAGLSTLVVERREIIGGCCVTEDVAPGCRVSATSYIASMLLPKVIDDLDLASFGLRMVPCDPILAIPDKAGGVIRWWADLGRTSDEIRRFSEKDAETFLSVDRDLKKLAAYLQPFFLEPPPNLAATGFERFKELWRLAKRFYGITGDEMSQLVDFLTGSLGDFLDRHFEAEETKLLFLANNVYGKHGGPYDQGSALGLLFHLLSGGDHGRQGFSGHVIGGMGSITQAIAASAKKSGVEIITSAPVARILIKDNEAYGVLLEDGTEILASVVLSNADPKRTFLSLVEAEKLPASFRKDVAAIKMAGPSAKVNLVLSEEPKFIGMPENSSPEERAVMTLVPSLEEAQRCYDIAKLGKIPDELWVDCVVPSMIDDSLAPPDRFMMTCFIQYVPYHLKEGTWDDHRESFGDRVIEHIARYAPNVPDSIIARTILTPLDLEQIYGITEGNIFHGDLSFNQLFFMRPLPKWTQYRTPVTALYLCGAGTHPGGGVTGAPGHNAAAQVLKDIKQKKIF